MPADNGLAKFLAKTYDDSGRCILGMHRETNEQGTVVEHPGYRWFICPHCREETMAALRKPDEGPVPRDCGRLSCQR